MYCLKEINFKYKYINMLKVNGWEKLSLVNINRKKTI